MSPTWNRSLPVAALVLLATVAHTPAHAAPSPQRPNLSVKSVTVDASTTPGATVDARTTLARAGDTPAATLRFYLSTGTTRDPRDVRLGPATTKLTRGGPARSLLLTTPLAIPAGQPTGTYRVIACIDDPARIKERNERDNCRASARSLNITAEPITTDDLVASAVAQGRLTHQQGLVYRVFATFGDRRLPRQYAGDRSEPDHGALREAASKWPTLTPAQRAQLKPFFTPPPVKGSWASPSTTQTRQAGASTPLGCVTGSVSREDWRSIARSDGHVRVWWKPADEERFGPRARALVTEIERDIWPKLAALTGREPLRDGNEKCFHGIDDKLDIYVTAVPGAKAMTVNYPPRCSATPAFILFDPRNVGPGGTEIRRWTVAHELMHAFQFAFKTAAPCENYDNWFEATATWAGQYVYPRDNDEHDRDFFTLAPAIKLGDADYDGWVFAYAMEKLHGAATIRATFDAGERLDVLQAIDAGVPGGLKKAYPEFARLAWNQPLVSPTFRDWDGFNQVPHDGPDPIEPEPISTLATGQTEAVVPLKSMRPLTRRYRHFTLDKSVTAISVSHSVLEHQNIQAVFRYPDGTTKTTHITEPGPFWCAANPADRPTEMLLVITNTSLTTSTPELLPDAKLLFTNIGCARYTGTASGTRTWRNPPHADVTETWTATDLVYTRQRPPDAGRELTDPAQQLHFELTGGTITWSMSGTYGGCQITAGPTTITLDPATTRGTLTVRVGAFQQHGRGYFANGFAHQRIHGTQTCPGGSRTEQFPMRGPFLSTTLISESTPFGADPILQGSNAYDEGGFRSASFTWRLVPEGVLGTPSP